MDQPKFLNYYNEWQILTAPFSFCFTLSELFQDSPADAEEYTSKTGITPYECIYLGVPTGFVTDLASIPKVIQALGVPADGPWTPAAILHDLLYQRRDDGLSDDEPFGLLGRCYDKSFADRVFRLAMLRYGVDPAIAEAMYLAVAAFGESSFTDMNSGFLYPIPGGYMHYCIAPFQFFHAAPLEESASDPRITVLYPNIKRAFVNAVL